jgi:transcriptional regulator with XRE-family HTH domain
MTELQRLLAALKRLLKARGLAYRDVAVILDLSEASVKRLFTNGRLGLDRLARLCDALGVSFAELAEDAAASAPRVRRLSEAQEAELIADTALLLVAACAMNHWSAADISRLYRISPTECLQKLLRLDGLGLIELLPGERIRLAIARDFDWLPDGPIRRYFREHGEPDFLDAAFGDAGQTHVFLHGMLSPDARAAVLAQIQQLRQRFNASHDDSRQMPNRRGVGMLLALREWEPPGFAALRRE